MSRKKLTRYYLFSSFHQYTFSPVQHLMHYHNSLHQNTCKLANTAQFFTNILCVNFQFGSNEYILIVWHSSSLAAKLLRRVTRAKPDVYSMHRHTVWRGPNGRFPYCTVVLAASKLRQKWLKMGWSEHLYRYLLFVRSSVGQKN